ncbi:MAG: proline--tRNA ligase, partial [Elusimicrobia bacterium]|nr:proline--tRNA ligase [Elusimicrobiota bacterium]
AAAIEQNHDQDGILWPPALAPFAFSVIVIDEADDARVRPAVDKVIGAVEAAGYDVLEDDRDAKPGVKFKDADLIGIPFRVVVSRKTLDGNCVEFKRRGSRDAERWSLDEVPTRLAALARL